MVRIDPKFAGRKSILTTIGEPMSTIKIEKSFDLRVVCPVTGKAVSTGIAMSLKAFETSKLDNNSFRCPTCGKFHMWSKKDVLLVQLL